MAANKISLTDWVNSFKVQQNELDYHRYATIPQIRDAAIRILRDLSYSSENSYGSARIDIVNNSYIPLPPSFLKETFVGILDTNTCKLIPLGKKDSISTAGDVLKDANDQPLLDAQGRWLLSEIACTPSLDFDLFYDAPYLYQYYYNSGVGRQYGESGGNNVFGYYKVSLDDDRIEIETNSATTQVVLEWVADPIMSADPKINTALDEALSDGVYYYLIKRLSNVPANEKERARREWNNSRRIGLAIMKASLSEEILQISRKGNLSVPKH